MSRISNLLGMVTTDQGACHHLSIELKSLIIKTEQSLNTSFVTEWLEAQLCLVKLLSFGYISVNSCHDNIELRIIVFLIPSTIKLKKKKKTKPVPVNFLSSSILVWVKSLCSSSVSVNNASHSPHHWMGIRELPLMWSSMNLFNTRPDGCCSAHWPAYWAGKNCLLNLTSDSSTPPIYWLRRAHCWEIVL